MAVSLEQAAALSEGARAAADHAAATAGLAALLAAHKVKCGHVANTREDRWEVGDRDTDIATIS